MSQPVKNNESLPVLNTLLSYFRVFHGYFGRELWLLCGIILIGGTLDGLGLSLLFPILSYDQPGAEANPYIRVIHQAYALIGLPVSLYSLLAVLFGVFLAKGVLLYWQNAMRTRIGTDMSKAWALEFTRKYAQMKYPYFIEKPIGYLNNLITTEIDIAVAGFAKYTEVIVCVVYIVVYLAAACLINWKITLLVVGSCGFLFLLLRGLSRRSSDLSIQVSAKNALIQSLLIQMIYNFKYMKATDSFEALYRQLSAQIDQRRKAQLKNGIISNIPSSILEPAAVLFLSGMILYYVAYLGRTMGEIIILLMFFYRSFSKLFTFQIAWHKFCSCIGGIEVLRTMTRELEEHKEEIGSRAPSAGGDIVLKDVRLSYGAREVLHGVNMRIPANKTVAIVGESGSGKTTILDIVTGLLVPQTGSVQFDGVDYRDLDRKALRSRIGYVTQEPIVFNDTVAHNISFWSEEHAPDELKRRIGKAADLAYCTDFIRKTEKGFDSILGDKGVKLSVGQRQRIAIARELFRDPRLMIFDEATSALDTESEILIQKSISSIAGQRTMIIVAHRLSTVRICDYIYVISDGRIVEEGTFEALYNKESGIFRQKCLLQNM